MTYLRPENSLRLICTGHDTQLDYLGRRIRLVVWELGRFLALAKVVSERIAWSVR
jgi:hypothetical protein